MSKEYFRYNGKTYQYENKEKQFKEERLERRRILLLTVSVALLLIISIAIGILISNRARINLGIPGNYMQSSSAHGVLTSPDESNNLFPPDSESAETNGGDRPVIGRPDALSLFSSDSSGLLSISSKYGIIIDRNTGEIIASKNKDSKMYPASLTKVMSIIVAYEFMLDHDVDIMSTYTSLTYRDHNYTIEEGASNAGFLVGETVRLVDVFYGAALPSGADAVLMLANYCYGSEEAFVDIMNLKCSELKLENTHFVTSTGLHDKNHYSTAADFAIITDYALKYDFIKALLATSKYTYGATDMQGKRNCTSTLYNWRSEYGSISKSEPDGALAFGGKSGYTTEAKHCLTSFLDTEYGSYIVVTCYGSGKRIPVDDYVKIYKKYAVENQVQVSTTLPPVISNGTTGNSGVTNPTLFYPVSDSNTKEIDSISSKYALLVDSNTGKIIAEKNAGSKIYPASLTKVLTATVAYEYMLKNNVDINNKYLIMTQAIKNEVYIKEASTAKYLVGEEVTVRDAFYGIILPSGADAVLMLAGFCYKNEAELVNAMNEKVKEIGLRNTNFVTATGLHDDNHYTTLEDMAAILKYCLQYDFIKLLLTTDVYTHPKTNMQEERKLRHTVYQRRLSVNGTLSETSVGDGLVFGGKTGFTDEARYCLFTFIESKEKGNYILITTNATEPKDVVYDYLEIYNKFIP